VDLGIVITTAVNAVVPIILLIFLGYALRRTGFLNENFTKTGNSLVFNLCLPAMLFVNVYNIENLSVIRWDVVAYCLGVIGILFLVGLISALTTTAVPERRGVILQCAFRSNFAIIGLPLAASLGGSGAEAMAAVISAFSIPVFNILAVISLSVFVTKPDGGKTDIKKILLNIAGNPLILGVAAGLLCLCIRWAQAAYCGQVVFSLKNQLQFLYTALNNLKAVASPLALIVLGAQFEFAAVKGLWKEITVATAVRIVGAPVLGIGLAALLNHFVPSLGWGANEYPALVALFGSPVAVSSAVMAKAMDNDGQLATQLVVWTSIGSMVTIFLTVCLLIFAGLLAV
jgi:predicted permease